MKRWAVVFVTFLSTMAFAETWNGTLTDVMCKEKDQTAHTKECAIKCSHSGYGLLLSDGKFLKFNDEGNTKALEALKAASKENDLKAEVKGTLDEDTIEVESISIE